MKPICVPCRRFYRMKKGGFYFIEQMPGPRAAGEANPPPGNAAPEKWKPYKLWAGDLWECPDCGAQIVSGTGREPVSEHYKPEFAETVKLTGADQLHVNDC